MFDTIHSTIDPEDVIDIHVHLGGPPGENDDMYFWSDRFTRSLAFRGMRLVTKLNATQVTALRYVNVIFRQLSASRHVDKAVLLALDHVYSEAGARLVEGTHLFVSNEFVASMAQLYREFLFGCSVHPYSQDAVERLFLCAENGAVLCKWLPSSQGIDPTHPLSVRFYRALAELGLPLLLHVGPEDAIPCNLEKKKELLYNSAAGDYGTAPGDAVSMALDQGATVIVAHCGTPLGALFDPDNEYWEHVFETFLERLSSADLSRPLYADISAFCLPGRYKYIKRLVPLAKEMPHRFLYGSDYPVPIVSFSEKRGLEEILETFGWIAGRALPTNDFDKNYQLLEKRFPKTTFTAASKVLRNPRRRPPGSARYLRTIGKKTRRIFHFQDD
ncbi:MAG: amidohydrolase family protein [Spirochaetes bacterium]|nr:amidohydrolase family protein [Spirochaetota bacterium]